ncbi:TPA: LysR family transcriptional regulator [Klebsiella pneumoniae]|nr:LysR family transcriptional regulator [Klebsiella pneumoniae]
MDIKLLRAFVTLSQLKRYNSAAEKLCVTQPELTKQIQTLESLSGITLFQRGRHGVRLTVAGELYNGLLRYWHPMIISVPMWLAFSKD